VHGFPTLNFARRKPFPRAGRATMVHPKSIPYKYRHHERADWRKFSAQERSE